MVFRWRYFVFNFLLAMVSVGLILVVVELVLAKFYPQKTFSAAEVFSPFCFRKSDYLPFQLKSNGICRQRQDEFDITVNTNSLGYRNPDFKIEKSAGVKRILLLGDSFAFGYGIADEKVYARVLQDLLKDKAGSWEVINAAYASGDSPDSYYAYLKKEGLAFSPDIVIMGLFVGNDFLDLFDNLWLETDESGLPTKISSLERFIDEEGRLRRRQDMPLNYRLPILKNSHLFQLVYSRLEPKLAALIYKTKKALGIAIVHQHIHPEPHVFCIHSLDCIEQDNNLKENIEKVLELVKATDTLVKQNSAHFLVLIIPADLQLYEEAWKRWGEAVPYENEVPDQPQALLVEFFEKEEINYIDLLPLFHQIPERLYYPFDAHFNEAGHRKTAEIILDYLVCLCENPRPFRPRLNSNYKGR